MTARRERFRSIPEKATIKRRMKRPGRREQIRELREQSLKYRIRKFRESARCKILTPLNGSMSTVIILPIRCKDIESWFLEICRRIWGIPESGLFWKIRECGLKAIGRKSEAPKDLAGKPIGCIPINSFRMARLIPKFMKETGKWGLTVLMYWNGSGILSPRLPEIGIITHP